MTACLRQLGVRSSFGVDYVKHKQVTAPVSLADLTTRAGQELLWQWLENPNVVGVFLAPPCGSASRARAIRLHHKSHCKHHQGPRPLRSDDHPNGLPHLAWTDKERIAKANILYRLTADVVRWAAAQRIPVVVENPQYSFFWNTTFWTEVSNLMSYTTFHSCQYGSLRQKRTMIAFSDREFRVISKKCKGQSAKHKHAKWGINNRTSKFATAEETAYPMALAKAFAACFITALASRGLPMPAATLELATEAVTPSLQVIRAQTGLQAKASFVPPLVPCYSHHVLLVGSHASLPAIDLLKRISIDTTLSSTPPFVLPKHAKLLALEPPPSKLGGRECSELVLQVGAMTSDAVCQRWGIPWSCEQFVAEAVARGHPCRLDSALPLELGNLFNSFRSQPSADRMALRAERLRRWTTVAKEIEHLEAQLKRSLHPDVRLILKNKRLLVWERMLLDNDYRDMDVVSELKQGSQLVGAVPPTGLWPKKFVPAIMTVKDLRESASRERSSLYSQFPKSDDAELEEEVWKQTLDEVKAGILDGPLDLKQVPVECPLSRRFGIRQGEKIRCIDDFARSSVNSAVQTEESPRPHTLDVVACMALRAMKVATRTGPWVGRTFDLKGAYRQCAINPDSSDFSHIMVQEPQSRRIWAFRMRALPFGSIRSVHSFLRVAHSLWFLGISELLVPWCNYFDDFVTLIPRVEVESVTKAVHVFFRLLGWRYAEEGPKAPPFHELFNALGISIDVSNLHRDRVLFDNTESRKRELLLMIEEILTSGTLSRASALRVRGRLQFASGQLFGRIARGALQSVTTHAYSTKTPKISPELVHALQLHKSLLEHGRPRTLKTGSHPTFYIFADASYEPAGAGNACGLGAVLVSQDGVKLSFFSASPPSSLLEKLQIAERKTIIFECELLAIYCALVIWQNEIRQSPVVIFTDNNGARDTLISCSTSSLNARRVLDATLKLECELMIQPWYARVPTESNIADAPSRFEVEHLLKEGARLAHLSFDVLEALLEL